MKRHLVFAVFVAVSSLTAIGCGSSSDDGVEGGGESAVSTRLGKFEVFQSENDEKFYFHLLAANGENVLRSQGYTSKQNAKNGIRSVKENALNASRLVIKESQSGDFYFNLKAANGETIGTSEMYVNRSNAVRGSQTVTKIVTEMTESELAAAADAKRGARFEAFKGKDNQTYFDLRAGNGEIVLQSEGYTSRQGALDGAASVKTNGSDKANYEVLEAGDSQFYFRLKAQNHEIIGRGELYVSKANAERAVDMLVRLLSDRAPIAMPPADEPTAE